MRCNAKRCDETHEYEEEGGDGGVQLAHLPVGPFDGRGGEEAGEEGGVVGEKTSLVKQRPLVRRVARCGELGCCVGCEPRKRIGVA